MMMMPMNEMQMNQMFWQCGTPVEYFSKTKERWINASVKSMEQDGAVELALESGRGRAGVAHVSYDKINSRVRSSGRYLQGNANDLHSPERTFEIQASLEETPCAWSGPVPSTPVASPTASHYSVTPKSDWSELECVLPRERDPNAMRAILLQGYKSTTEFNANTPKSFQFMRPRDQDSESTFDGTQSTSSSAGDLQHVANRSHGAEAKDRFRESNVSDEDANSKTRRVAQGLHECLVLKGFKNNKPNLLMDVAMAIWADIGSDTPGKAELERLANILGQHSDLFTVVNKPVLRHSRAAREQEASPSPFSQTACLIRVL